MLLALVDEEPAGEALDLPPVDEEMERELMGREEVEPPVAIEVPAPVSQPVTSGDIMDSLTSRVNLGVTSVSELVGEKTDMSHDHKNQQGTPVIQCDYCFLKTEEDAPMVTVLVAIDTVCKQMVAIPLEKNGNKDPFASRSLAAFARYVGHPNVIIQGDSAHALVAHFIFVSMFDFFQKWETFKTSKTLTTVVKHIKSVHSRKPLQYFANLQNFTHSENIPNLPTLETFFERKHKKKQTLNKN